MSNSSDSLFLIKEVDDENEIKFENFSSPISNSSNGSPNCLPSSQKLDQAQEIQEEDQADVSSTTPKTGGQKESSTDDQTATELGKSEVGDDDDDGFRTPTSLDHKIPVLSQCPPAPRKSRPTPPPSRKRKSSPRLRRTIRLELSVDNIESMFPPRIQEAMGRKIKKIRRDDGS